MANSLRDLPPEQLGVALDFIESLPNHPEYGHEIKRVLKKINPQIQYPEIDLEDRVSQATKKQAEELAALKAELKDKENKSYWQEQRRSAKAKYDLNDDDTKEIEKYMIDKHVGDYDTAARVYSLDKHASAEPTNYQDVTGLQLPSNEGLFSNPIGWARNEALKTVNEIRRNRNY